MSRLLTHLPLAMLVLAANSGCAALSQKLAGVSQIINQRHQLKSEIHEQRVLQKQMEKQHELDCIRAEFEQCKDAQQAQFQQRLKSRLTVELAQHIQMSDVKIDGDKLQAMLEQAKKADQAAKDEWDVQQAKQLEDYMAQLREYARKQVAYEAHQAQQAANCGQPVANDCCKPAPPCKPTPPVLKAEAPPSQTDMALNNLPLKIELRLNLNARNPRIEQARQQLLPSERAMQCKTPCNCGECAQCTSTSPIFPASGMPPAPAALERDN